MESGVSYLLNEGGPPVEFLIDRTQRCREVFNTLRYATNTNTFLIRGPPSAGKTSLAKQLTTFINNETRYKASFYTMLEIQAFKNDFGKYFTMAKNSNTMQVVIVDEAQAIYQDPDFSQFFSSLKALDAEDKISKKLMFLLFATYGLQEARVEVSSGLLDVSTRKVTPFDPSLMGNFEILKF